jgi:hypothetical protein
MKCVEVHRLSTDEVITFTDVSPAEAVIYAYLSSLGVPAVDWPRFDISLRSGLRWGWGTVAMGDFCARTNKKKVVGRDDAGRESSEIPGEA